MLRLATIYLLFIFLFLSCKQNRSVTNGRSQNDSILIDDTSGIARLPILIELKSEEVHLTEKVFGRTIDLIGTPLSFKEIIKPQQLLVKNKYLITKNDRKDSVFMIFELPDLKCISAFGVIGRGPDEFVYPPEIIETEEDSILFYIYELNNEKIYKVNLKSLKPEYYLSLPKHNKGFDSKQIVFINNKKAIYVSNTSKSKMIYTFNKDSLQQGKELLDLAIPGIKGSWTTYIGDFGVNMYYGRIAYAYKYFKRIRILDINSMTERHIVFDAEELTEGQNDIATLEPTNVTHFWGMSPKKEAFWMLYSGRTPVDVQRDNRNNNKYIFVEKYDWNGNPLKRYRLDDWGYFCVDNQDKTIYLASTASVYSMLKYNIPDN